MASKMGKEDDLHIHSSHNGALLSFLSPARFSKENRFSPENAEPYLSRRAAANARIFSENARECVGWGSRWSVSRKVHPLSAVVSVASDSVVISIKNR